LLMLPLGILRPLPKLGLLRLPRYLYETSKSERFCREIFAVGLCGGGHGSSIGVTKYRPKRWLPKRCRRHLNRHLSRSHSSISARHSRWSTRRRDMRRWSGS
jgi:hypothetical protein